MNRVYSVDQGLGRYECQVDGSSKFWECWPDAEAPGTFATRWGKIGAKHSWHRCKRGLSSWEALDKINEKRSQYSWIHARHISLQEAVAEECAADMRSKTVKATPAEAPTPSRRF